MTSDGQVITHLIVRYPLLARILYFRTSQYDNYPTVGKDGMLTLN